MSTPAVRWDGGASFETPSFEFDPDFVAPGPEANDAPGVRALYLDGPPWRGRPTRVFAWYGVPDVPAGTRVPGMVLVHGGGGTAFADWVRLWNDRGYAAISMDTCGCTAGGKHGERPRHDAGGPPGWGGFDQIDESPEDQWMFHAVASALVAHSFLRSRDEVDSDRIGLTGISWGGIIASIVAGVDARLRLVVPVYGAGRVALHNGFAEREKTNGDGARRWVELWDPSNYLPEAAMPMLWLTGTNDFAFPLSAVQESSRQTKGEATLSFLLRMPHGQGDGAWPEEIRIFADHHLRGCAPLADIAPPTVTDGRVAAACRSEVIPREMRLLYTRDDGPWLERAWHVAPAERDWPLTRITAVVPDGARMCFVNLVDARGMTVSSEYIEL